MMPALLALHGVIGLALFPTGTRLGRRSFLVAAIAPLLTLVWLATRLPDVVDGTTVSHRVSWVPQLGLALDLRLDGFGALMVLLVSGIGLAVFVYAAAYFAPNTEGLARSAGLLTLFAGAMLCVVLADNLLVLYTGWELTSVTSYLLIGNDHQKPNARAAALHALLVTSAGGLAMLAGFVLVGEAAGTYSLSAILSAPPTGTPVTVGVVLMLVGAFTKSAQYPFHSWLPGAMAAPTPVSAYLHSATMVKAGVYLIARLAPVFATLTIWRPLVIGVGLLTMIAGGLRALRQDDLKLLLAFGTVSQLGFLVVMFGAGTPTAIAAATTTLLAHGLFKATLFMVVGTIDRHTGTRDVRLIPDLGPGWRPLKLIAAISALSMAGVPMLFGFVAKEADYEALYEGGFGGSRLVLAGIVAGSILTFAYSARFLWGAFSPAAGRRPPEVDDDRMRSPAWPGTWFVRPAAVLALLTLLFGVLPGSADGIVGAAAGSLDKAAGGVHLAVWHGLGAPLALSALTIVLGAVVFVVRRPLDTVLRRGSRVPDGTEVYTSVLRGLNTASDRVTAVVQNGSLPIYAGVTLLTAATVPGVVLLTQAPWPGWPPWIERAGQVPLVIAILGAAFAAGAVRRRFSAALFLGTVGYAMAGLFIVQGAPDLALTQVAIETLTTVLFVLVLRRLPDRFERTSTSRRRVLRVAISLAVGVMVFSFAIVSRGSRQAEPVSSEIIERSLPEGHGKNVVNVILVDIRGFDTFGEITVLASAAIGAVALARAGGGRRRRSAQSEATS